LTTTESLDPELRAPVEIEQAYEKARSDLEESLASNNSLAALRWFSPELVDARDYIVDARAAGHTVAVDFAPIALVGGGYLALLHIDVLGATRSRQLHQAGEIAPRWVWVEPFDDGPWTIYPEPPERVTSSALVTRVDGEVTVDPNTSVAEVRAVLQLDTPLVRNVVFDFVHDLDVMAEIAELSQDGRPLRHTHVREKLIVELAEVSDGPVALRLRYRLTPMGTDGDTDAIVQRGPWIPRRPGSEPEWNVRRR